MSIRELKYDVRRGADTYRMIYHSRLKSWILRDIIKRDEALVWRSGLSGWRRPEDLPELKPYFEQWEEAHLRSEEFEVAPLPFLKKEIENILIVDDEEDLCWLLSNSLKSRGYTVATANTISEALPCLKEPPDLIFLDLKLPDGDGMDILPQIKRMSPDAAVVIISAYGSEERRLDAKKKGIHSFIDKPLSEEKVMNAIGQFQQED
jgi:CheY-like chemotaxis protein